MLRALTALTLALCLLGCGSSRPRGEPVALLTGVDACYAGGEQGVKSRLLVDPLYGASFDGRPVMWPVGFTGVRVGAEVAVLDPAGKIVAMTGRMYFMSYAPVYDDGKARLMESLGAFPAAANCGYPWDLKEVWW